MADSLTITSGPVIGITILLAINVIVLYVCAGYTTAIQGDRDTNNDFREVYKNLALILLIVLPIVCIGILFGVRYMIGSEQLHIAFYLVPSILSFSLAFGALAISYVSWSITPKEQIAAKKGGAK